jgi:hypothetical protein
MSVINMQINEVDQLAVIDINAHVADRCVICYEDIDSTPSYELPECKHIFHQTCINSWFRQGNSKCPLCNNVGAGLTSKAQGGYLHSWAIKFNFLRRFSKKKNAPLTLTRAMERLKKREDALRQLEVEYKDNKNKTILVDGQPIVVKDFMAKMERKRKSLRSRRWTILKCKRIIVFKNNIVPLIIVEKKSV